MKVLNGVVGINQSDYFTFTTVKFYLGIKNERHENFY